MRGLRPNVVARLALAQNSAILSQACSTTIASPFWDATSLLGQLGTDARKLGFTRRIALAIDRPAAASAEGHFLVLSCTVLTAVTLVIDYLGQEAHEAVSEPTP